MTLYEENSDRDLFSEEDERNRNDLLAVVSCTQKLIEANDRVLAAFGEGRKEQEDMKEAVAAIQAKQEEIVAALSNLQQSCSSPQNHRESRPQSVNKEVSLQVRGIYKDLLSRGDFQGWMLDKGVSFTDETNRPITDTLVKEVKGQNPDISEGEIRRSCKRYYRTLSQRHARREKVHDDNIKQRRRQRRIRKLRRRKNTAQKVLKNEPNRLAKWKRVLTMEMMSSEESIDSGSEDDAFKVRPLPWRSEKYCHFLTTLDASSKKSSSRKSKRMQNPRMEGEPSSRNPPINKFRDSLWVFKRAYHPVTRDTEP